MISITSFFQEATASFSSFKIQWQNYKRKYMRKNKQNLVQLKMTSMNQELPSAFNSTDKHNLQMTEFKILFTLEDYRDICKRKIESNNTFSTTTIYATSATSSNAENDHKEDILPVLETYKTNYYRNKVPKDPCRILKSLTSNEIRRLISTSYVINSSVSFGKGNYCLLSSTGPHNSKNTKRSSERQVV